MAAFWITRSVRWLPTAPALRVSALETARAWAASILARVSWAPVHWPTRKAGAAARSAPSPAFHQDLPKAAAAAGMANGSGMGGS